MRSPSEARFPAAGLVLSLALLMTSCTSGGDAPAETRDPTGSPTRETRSDPGDDQAGGSGGGNEASGAATSVSDGDSRRTVTGTAPAYVEIAEAGVTGTAGRVSLSMSLSGPIPERMPDETSALRVSFRLKAKTGRTFTFDAHCVRAGWGTFAAGGPEEFPAPKLSLAGNKIEMHVDPAYMDGLQPFDWIATVTWSGKDGDYAFDVAPKSGLAGYP